MHTTENYKDDRFLFLKIHLSSIFLALQVSHRVQWGSNFPHAFLLLKKLTIVLITHLLNKNHLQDKNDNVVDFVCYTDKRLKCVQKEVFGVTNKLKPDGIMKEGYYIAQNKGRIKEQ